MPSQHIKARDEYLGGTIATSQNNTAHGKIFADSSAKSASYITRGEILADTRHVSTSRGKLLKPSCKRPGSEVSTSRS